MAITAETPMQIDQNELERLSKAATQGEWKISAYYTGTGPDEKCHGLVVVEDFPIGIIDEEGATAESLSPNLEFVTTLVNAYRASQLVPVQQPSEPYDPAQNCLEVPPNILASGKMLAAMRKSAQPSGDVVDSILWHVEQVMGPISREVCENPGDDDYSVLRQNVTAAITAYEALRAKDTRP